MQELTSETLKSFLNRSCILFRDTNSFNIHTEHSGFEWVFDALSCTKIVTQEIDGIEYIRDAVSKSGRWIPWVEIKYLQNHIPVLEDDLFIKDIEETITYIQTNYPRMKLILKPRVLNTELEQLSLNTYRRMLLEHWLDIDNRKPDIRFYAQYHYWPFDLPKFIIYNDDSIKKIYERFILTY